MEHIQSDTMKEELDALIVALRDIQKEFIMKLPGVSNGIDKMLQEFEGYREMLSKPAGVMIMGRTGAGKSSFINALVGNPDLVKVGFSAYSETKQVEDIACSTEDGTQIVFLDTRGSGESGSPDSEALSQITVAAEKYKPSVAIILMPPDRAHWDEDLAFFTKALKSLHDTLNLDLTVIGVITKIDTIVDPFHKENRYDWENPSTLSEEKMADWCNRLRVTLSAQLQYVNNDIRVFPVCSRFGLNDNGEQIDERWGLDAIWGWLGEHAPFEVLLNLSEFIDPSKRRDLAINLVHRFSVMAGIVGALPISFADAPVLAYLQQALIRVIYAVARDATKPAPKQYIHLLGGSAKLAGKIASRQFVAYFVELIPGWGTVVGSAANAVIAAGFTEMFGQAAVKYYFDGWDVPQVLQTIKNFKVNKESHDK